METLIENVIVYSLAALFAAAAVFFYVRKQRRDSRIVEAKIEKAKQEGLYEPVSLHPVVNPDQCIKTGACIAACPEKDILGIVNGKATTVNASHCVGHGACFHACPTEAITLCIGTEKRGVELPHVAPTFETNVAGIYIAGELGGMGLIKNAVEQGKQAVTNIAKYMSDKNHGADYDLVIVGAGPAGISATLTACKLNLKALTLEQDTLGGTVYTFPRAKIVMTSSMELPLYGKVKLFETSKTELLELWNSALSKNNLKIQENSKVESILIQGKNFQVQLADGQVITTHRVLLAIGRRGSPRKLGIPGENMEKVAYRLLEPELIHNEDVIVVGGGDSAIESALLLAGQNRVMLSYRGDAFNRIKPKNKEKISEAARLGQVDIRFNTELTAIEKEFVVLKGQEETRVKNDRVFIFAGGELPTSFLQKTGIQITKKFGEAVLKH